MDLILVSLENLISSLSLSLALSATPSLFIRARADVSFSRALSASPSFWPLLAVNLSAPPPRSVRQASSATRARASYSSLSSSPVDTFSLSGSLSLLDFFHLSLVHSAKIRTGCLGICSGYSKRELAFVSFQSSLSLPLLLRYRLSLRRSFCFLRFVNFRPEET